MAICHRAVLTVLSLLCVANTSWAQDMRVYTRIYSGDAPEPIAKSLTFFHAGKVYDYIEPAQEVTVYEAALQRFTIVNKPRQLRSEITQEEIRHFLSLAQVEVMRLLGNPPNAAAQKANAFMQFQLQPEFVSAFDPGKRQLTLSSSSFNYTATAFIPETPDVAEKYLHVADWTAQFNSVLHPKSLLPAPRMALNQELRQRGMIPQIVELKVDTEPPIHLTARHEWTWNLTRTDRQLIDEWEMDLQNPAIRNVSFRKFQQEMLRLEPARKR